MDQLLQYAQYPLITLLFFGLISGYLKLAEHYHILDKPNGRSSHDYVTVRGGGILFLVAGIIFTLHYLDLPGKLFFLAGLLLIGTVSFLDDIVGVPALWRLLVQIAAVTFAFYGTGLYEALPWCCIISAYILFTGIINAFNFMDGINGMTGLYSLVVLASLQWINLTQIHFAHPDFIWYGMLACGVFLWYNFRKKARCFAGDVGSVSIAFWVIFLMLKLMVLTQNFVWILLLSVYGVETVCTLLHRLILKESIFKPHRTFFFQILSNEYQCPQRVVSSLYALSQILVSAIVILFGSSLVWWLLAPAVLLPLAAMYCFKFRLMNRFCKE